MPTALELVTAFRDTYPQCSEAVALQILNEVEEEVLLSVPMRGASMLVALVKGVAQVPLSADVLRVWQAVRWDGPNQFAVLSATDPSALRWENPGYSAASPGAPGSFYLDVDEAQGMIAVHPKPIYGSLSVVGATNTSPIVLTTAVAHGLATGGRVKVAGVAGNLGANGDWTVTSLTSTTLSLNGSTGSGVYSAGGLVASAAQWSFLECRVTRRSPLTLASEMARVPHVRRLYELGMCYLWCLRRRKLDEAMAYRVQFERDLAEQSRLTIGRTAGLPVQIDTFRQLDR